MSKRIILLTLASVVLLATPALAGHYHNHNHHDHDGGFEIDFDGSTLIIGQGNNSHRWSDDVEIEITRDLELYVDGEQIDTDRHERKLLQEYYDLARDVVDQAEELEEIGEKMEIDGEILGRQIEVNVLRRLAAVFDDDYDRRDRDDDDEWDEDLEDDWDLELDELTEWIEEITEEAEEIGEDVEEMEDIMDDLQNTIDELDELDWL